MHKVFFISVISLIMLTAGCFQDADTLSKPSESGFKDFEFISGKFCSDGFIQLNSSKLVKDFSVRIYEHSTTYTKSLSPIIDVFRNKLSRQYSYIIGFGKISDRSIRISIEVIKNGDLIIDFSFNIEQYLKLPAIENVRELGESALFKTEGDSILGSSISTKPNIWVKFSHSVCPAKMKVQLESLSDESIIPCTLEYSENPFILVQASEKLNNDKVYRLIFKIDETEINSKIQFITKKYHGVFSSLDVNTVQKDIITPGYLISMANTLDVTKVVEFNDFIVAETHGAYIFPETYNFVVLSTDGSLKLIENYRLKSIAGKIELDAISGMISADFDNNGLEEILIYNNFGESVVYRINNAYELEYFNEYNFGMSDDLLTSLTISDVDNNGWYDFVVGYASGLVNMIYRSEIFIDFKMIPVTRLDAPVNSIELADLNRDSILDLVISDKSGRLSVYLRISNSWQPKVLSDEFHIRSFIVHDLNHDGYKDIIAHSDEVYLLYFRNLIFSFEQNRIEYPDNEIVGDLRFSSGFEQHGITDLLIYLPLMNSIRTFSLISDFQSVNVSKSIDIGDNLFIKKSSFKFNESPRKIVSAELNNDRLDDLVVFTDKSLSIYFQMRDVNAESFTYAREHKILDEYSKNIQITDLDDDSYKEILVLKEHQLIVVSASDFSDITLNLPLVPDETLTDFVHFNQDRADYLAILTSQRLLIGTIQTDSTSKSYVFNMIHEEFIVANAIYALDFNEDGLTDIIVSDNIRSMLYLSELDDESTNMQFRISIVLPFVYSLKSVNGEFNSFVKVEDSKLQLCRYTELGLDVKKYNLMLHNGKNPKIVIFMNDIDKDGDDDIFLLRKSDENTTADVLINNSNKTYKHHVEFSRKLTSIVKSNNLRYIGLLDLDSDSWTDIVFRGETKDMYILKFRYP
ncbi:MAG: VCBS repeat-containing protein [Planctomycetes bacterium]|nr:VCBS repeat-containing protein [Planctomycetota bacterium]